MSAEIQGLLNGNAALVVERVFSLAAKPLAVMAVMRGPTPAARTLHRFGSTTVWYSNKQRLTSSSSYELQHALHMRSIMQCMPD